MENVIADFFQFSRARAKSFLNFCRFQRSFKSFGFSLATRKFTLSEGILS